MSATDFLNGSVNGYDTLGGYIHLHVILLYMYQIITHLYLCKGNLAIPNETKTTHTVTHTHKKKLSYNYNYSCGCEVNCYSINEFAPACMQFQSCGIGNVCIAGKYDMK